MRLIPTTTSITGNTDGLWIYWRTKRARSPVTSGIRSFIGYSSAPVRSWIFDTNRSDLQYSSLIPRYSLNPVCLFYTPHTSFLPIGEKGVFKTGNRICILRREIPSIFLSKLDRNELSRQYYNGARDVICLSIRKNIGDVGWYDLTEEHLQSGVGGV